MGKVNLWRKRLWHFIPRYLFIPGRSPRHHPCRRLWKNQVKATIERLIANVASLIDQLRCSLAPMPTPLLTGLATLVMRHSIKSRLMYCITGSALLEFRRSPRILGVPKLFGSGHVQRYLQSLGLLFLVLNIVLVSIPRCEIVLSLLQHQGWPLAETVDEGAACHDAAASVDGQAQAFTSQRFCECFVFQFMAFHVPQLNLHEHVYFRVQSERLLTFPMKYTPSDFQPPVEPPYPKA